MTRYIRQTTIVTCVLLGMLAVAACGGSGVPSAAGGVGGARGASAAFDNGGGEEDGRVGVAPEALASTCPMTSWLCGDDGLGGDHYTLWLCTKGQAPVSPQSCPYGCLTNPGTNDACGHPYVANATVMNVARNGHFDGLGRLLWADDPVHGTLGGNHLPPATGPSSVSYASESITQSSYECAGFAERASGAPVTASWFQGWRAIDNCPAAGTVVATFDSSGHYAGHTASIVNCSSTTLDVFDSNWIDYTQTMTNLDHVGRHKITTGTKPESNAGNYYVVLGSQFCNSGSCSACSACNTEQANSLAIKSDSSCLDVPGWSTANGVDLDQWTCNGGNNQKFVFLDAGGGYYSIVNENSGKCLDVPSWSTTNGVSIDQWSCNGGDNQKFQMEDAGNGYYFIVNKNSSKCLDVPNWSTTNGVGIDQWSCNGGDNQKFRLF